MSVFCNLGRTPWVYRAFSYQRLFADAEKGPMQIALGQSDICEFESYMPSHAVVSVGPLECAENPVRAASRYARRRRGSASILPRCSVSPALSRQAWPSASRSSVVYKAMVDILKAPKNDGVRAPR